MLANGAKLEYKEKSDVAGAYKELPGLKEIPDCGVEPEKVENTGLNDKNKQYENGIGDLGDMTYCHSCSNLSMKMERQPVRIAFFEKHRNLTKYLVSKKH